MVFLASRIHSPARGSLCFFLQLQVIIPEEIQRARTGDTGSSVDGFILLTPKVFALETSERSTPGQIFCRPLLAHSHSYEDLGLPTDFGPPHKHNLVSMKYEFESAVEALHQKARILIIVIINTD